VSKRKAGRLNADLDGVMKGLMKDVRGGKDHEGKPLKLEDKLRLLDRILKWEAIKVKITDDDWGSGFANEE